MRLINIVVNPIFQEKKKDKSRSRIFSGGDKRDGRGGVPAAPAGLEQDLSEGGAVASSEDEDDDDAAPVRIGEASYTFKCLVARGMM